MNYIVLDMEWNQPWPGSPSSKKVLPVAIRGEIIQIGAVRLTPEGAPAAYAQPVASRAVTAPRASRRRAGTARGARGGREGRGIVGAPRVEGGEALGGTGPR